MKILILSFYYRPDLSAGAFRCAALVDKLSELIDSGVEIDVITTSPNRYASFNVSAPEFEQHTGVTIRRIVLPLHRSGFFDQAKAFVCFAKETKKLVKYSDYALVFATSGRLMTAVLAACVAHQKKVPLYLDIRDIFIDTLGDILPFKLGMCVKPIFSFLEKWSFSRAKRINLVSKGFQPYVCTRYPKIEFSWYTNGVATEFITSEFNRDRLKEPRLLTILYAGNIGDGQGLHLIIPALARRFEGRAQFKLIGDGGQKKQLEVALQVAQSNNVELLPPVSREKLIQEYQEADILFLHLNDYQAFQKVLPSKLFEYAATGKPIWAGVSGYPAEFICTEIINAAVFYPCNDLEAEAVFSTLALEVQPRKNFIDKYSRDHILQSMSIDVLSLLS